MSKAEYAKQADAICKEADSRQEALLRKATAGLSAELSPSERADLVKEAGIPPLEEVVDQLTELGVPSGNEEKAEDLIDALETAIGKVEEDPIGFSEGENTPFVPAERIAGELQLQVCGAP